MAKCRFHVLPTALAVAGRPHKKTLPDLVRCRVMWPSQRCFTCPPHANDGAVAGRSRNPPSRFLQGELQWLS